MNRCNNLLWMYPYSAKDAAHQSYQMAGTGGNKEVVFSDLELVIQVATINYGVRNPHRITDKLIAKYILAALE